MNPLRASRRSLLTGALGLGAGVLLSACGDAGDDSGPAADQAWEYTDDRGKKLTLKARPQRVVAYAGAAAALWDLGLRPVGMFGPSKRADGSQDPQSGSVDLNAVTSVGNTFGEFNVEKYLSLRPDLLVSVMYDKKLWYVPDDSAAKIEQIAPTVGLNVAKVGLTDVLGRFEKLARALGADTGATSVTEAKAAFDKAGTELADAAKAAAGVRVLALSASQDAVYVTIPEYYPDLTHLAERGVDLVVPAKADPTGFWETLSWENVAKYPADVIMYDARTQALQPDQLKSNAAWSRLPAVTAGQLIPWYSETPFSHRNLAPKLSEVATGLRRATKVR
jgi:iron complex transport system substrate-binding protein